jgi:hypothetical protein
MQVKLPIEFSRTPHVCDTLEASKDAGGEPVLMR